MKIEKMIEFVCAVCKKTFQTRKGISNHMNKFNHFEGHTEEFSMNKSERELERIEKQLKKDINKIKERR